MNGYVPITDLHNHILPGIDDGARNPDLSRALLQSEKEQGTEQILFTPHFYANHMDFEEFFRNRDASFASMKGVIRDMGFKTKLGAEVRLQEKLFELDLPRLRMGNTHYLLLEWPFDGSYPVWVDEIVDRLLRRGIRPLFAHIERYDFFFRNEENLRHFMDKGCVFHINADTVSYKRTSGQAIHLLKDGFVHMICSDAHDPGRRPVRLDQAYDFIEEKVGPEAVWMLRENADTLFNDGEVHTHRRPPVRRRLFGLF